MKPIINLDELTMESPPASGSYEERFGVISDRIGARKLGYNLTVLPPGKKCCPFHSHRVLEEMFLILEGTGTLRFGDQTYPLRPMDVIACPPGGPEVAHQIHNTGDTELKFFALSTREREDICEYPDSGTVGVYAGEPGKDRIRLFFPRAAAGDYPV